MDLDAVLDAAADTMLDSSKSSASKPATAPTAVTSTSVPAEIKPWLAFSANVPRETRDKWNTYVKNDRNATPATPFQPSNSYRSWDSQPMNHSKLIHDLVKKAATQAGLDESKTQKLLTTFHPVTETDFSRQVQSSYYKQIIDDVSDSIVKDPNYDPQRFPHLAQFLAK